ncbi:hypothetical protein [Aquibacillus kalidii]|uniref:hypothetical protein n=1 Tax=Aquibacillus kalidii TaxID=2762597 RepID=UPI001648FB67|nr:hypothetical protein [Aquibacillus kalidii]
MDNRKPISVKMNGKETFIRDHSQPQPKPRPQKDSWTSSFEEQAAAVDKSFNPEDLIEYEKTEHSDEEDWFSQLQSKKKKKPKVPKAVKLFGVAAAAAAIIGITLGFVMLRMFVGIDNDGEVAQGSGAMPAVSSTNNDNKGGQASTTSFSTASLSAFLIQGGVFQSEEQAKATRQSFTDAGYASMLWQNDGSYHVFVGAGATSQDLDTLEAEMIDKGLEIYAGKPWQTEATEVSVTSAEAEWLKGFAEKWQAALSMNQADLSSGISSWEEWLKTAPKDASKQVSALQSVGNTFVKDVKDGASSNNIQVHLLTMWNKYEQIGKE